MRRILTVLVSVLAPLAAVGCGSGAPSTACDYVTDAQAADLLGEPVLAGVEPLDESRVGSYCEWIAKSSSREPQVPVYGLHLSVSDDQEQRADFDERPDERSRIFGTERVRGLGDDAYYVVYTEQANPSGPAILPELYVRVGDRILDVGVYDSDERPVTVDEAQDLERALAEIAVARLEG